MILKSFLFFISSYDIEQQEVIELPAFAAQPNLVPFNTVDENVHSTPPPLINKADILRNDVPETSSHRLDVRFDVPTDQNLDQNDK